MDLLDRINETMNMLKQQSIQLKEREAEVEMYKEMLKSGHKSIGNSEFLISSTGMLSKRRALREVLQKLLPLVEKQRSDLECYKESEKQQEEEGCRCFSMTRLIQDITTTRDILKKQVDEYKSKIEKQEDQVKEYISKTEELERKVDEQAQKIQEYQQQLSKSPKEWQEQMENEQPHSFLSSRFHRFINEKHFQLTSFSNVILDKIADRLYNEEEEDEEEEPPLADIDSPEGRRQQVIDYIEFSRMNWNDPYLGSEIQQNIHHWLCDNWHQFIYNPSEETKEKSRTMFLKKFGLQNTIGTIHFLPVKYNLYTIYFCFAICNYKIVECSHEYSQQGALSEHYNNLKELPTWTRNSQFATEMKVDNKHSDTFIYTSNKDVFVENEKVVTWMKNNFDLEQEENRFEGFEYPIPALYNLIASFYDLSFVC